jgi:hypothetical protein
VSGMSIKCRAVMFATLYLYEVHAL